MSTNPVVAIFDATSGVVTDKDGRVTEWRDAREGSGRWKLITASPTSSPLLVSQPTLHPHILFEGAQWLILENHQVNGFKLDYRGEGSVLAIVAKNDKGTAGFHELFGGAGQGPNTQVRFETPTELMVYPVHNFFAIGPSTDRFHSYILRSYKGELEVYQDGVKVNPSRGNSSAKSDAPPAMTHMAAVGCWFSKHALHGRISYISFLDSALKENETQWNDLLSTVARACEQANLGRTFEAVPTDPTPTAAFPPPGAGNGRFLTNPPFSFGNVGLPTNPPAAPLGGMAPTARPARKPKSAWRAVFDGSQSLSRLSSLRDADPRKGSSTGPPTSPDICFLPTKPSLFLLNDGITYRLMRRKADELEGTYGDETIIKSEEAFRDVLSNFLEPSLAKEEVQQWQALWMVASGQNENVLSGIPSEEELLRAYYFRHDASSEQAWAGYCSPHEFVLLHRDSSGECFCHGECALFVSYRDPCAHKRHTDSMLPLYAIPLAYGSYGNEDLAWSSFLPDIEAISGILAEMQKQLKRISRDRIFCSN